MAKMSLRPFWHSTVDILPRHWLYEWFSQFHSCGTYSVLSRSPPIVLSITFRHIIHNYAHNCQIHEAQLFCKYFSATLLLSSRPAVTSPATEHHRPLAGTKLYCLTTEAATRAIKSNNWMGPWKNRISSTTMKLRKSLVKPVTRQNILSCLVLPPEIVMQDAFDVILWTFADIYVVHDDLGRKNRTTRYNRFWRAGCSRLEYVNIRLVY